MVGGYSKCLFSIEIPEGIRRIDFAALTSLGSLRNVAFPADSTIDEAALHICPDLRVILGVEDERGVCSEGLDVINPLKHRFDNLPLHKMIYYISYTNITAEQLNNATNIRISQRRSKLDPSGNQQDCLGMTPLHILACSTVQQLGLYRVLVEKYPETLIKEDRWGALPIFYAIWGNSPDEIVQFLVESYQSLYPNHELNWSMMIETLGKAGAPKETIQSLIDVQRESFLNHQIIDWGTILQRATSIPSPRNNFRQTPFESFGNLLEFSIKERVGVIGPRWRDNIRHLIHAFDDESDPELKMSYESSIRRRNFITELETKLAQSEIDHHNLNEACTILELTLWKKELNDKSKGEQRSDKRTKLDESSVRKECRIGCGADIVIGHVLPYLLPNLVRQPPDSNRL